MKHKQARQMIGERSGLLTVADVVRAPKEQAYYTPWLRCRCDCGGEITVQPHAIVQAHIKSCGCLAPNHGMTGTKEHNAWMGMQKRCTNPNDPAYDYIGAKGIKVCDRWNRATGGSFANFLADVGPAPGIDYFLDRKDRSGDYTPDNTTWTQGQNSASRRAKQYTIDGETRTTNEWATHWSMSRTGARHRLLNSVPECEWRH